MSKVEEKREDTTDSGYGGERKVRRANVWEDD